MNVSAPTGSDDDAYWQRPDSGPDQFGADRPSPAPDAKPAYQGPPRPAPASPYWRPPTVSHPPPPRSMPAQDIDALDESEGSARTVTYGVGLVAGAIALILMCLLCARAIF
ncbi:translation initiation factor 2 [Couchioplanes caeruleus]|uniref:translation initiation factor 2 n=1 Tax=Couchioplanes caeruleus TaxID=56438 RepID=UPI0020BFEEF2|nr:translation initiation factor 2 [Couchioplanes caeruleus]UQU65511.1 translation initiation factor 2 [Couchioplanes caeruleus]